MINLNNFRQNIYSHVGLRPTPCYGEDGVLLKIFEEVRLTTSPTVVEFGELRSLGTTTRSIRIRHKAKSVYFSGTLDSRSKILNVIDVFLVALKFREIEYLKFLMDMPFQAWLSIGDFPKKLKALSGKNVDLVVVDIDSFDYEVVKEIIASGIQPTCFVVEYNPSLPVEIPLYLSQVASKHPNLSPRVYGASYAAWENLFTSHGYQLVHVSGFCNLFYLKKSDAKLFEKPDIWSEVTDSNEKVLAFAEKWCLTGFRPSWLSSPALSTEDLQILTQANS
jgi:hypothetical protein